MTRGMAPGGRTPGSEISDQGSELRQSLVACPHPPMSLAGAMGAALVNGMAAGAPKISAGRSLKTRSVARPASSREQVNDRPYPLMNLLTPIP